MESLTGSLALSVAYGVNVESESDKFYAASEDAMNAVDAALVPGAFLVDALPIRMSSSQQDFPPSSLTLTQSSTSRNGFPEPVSRGSRGWGSKTLIIPSTFRSSMLRNLSRFAVLPSRPSILMERISGRDSYHAIDCGDMSGGIAGAQQRRS